MKCIKCTTENINKANYCKKCKYKFSKKEQEIAHSNTIVGKLELIEKAYGVCTLKIITDHILFKVATLMIVLGIGIYFWINNGINLRLLNSDNYEVQYNTEEKEYYLLTDKNKVALNLYVPNRTKKILIIHYDNDNNIIDKSNYNKDDKIVLESNQDDYYVLKIKYLNDKTDSLKLYVFKK